MRYFIKFPDSVERILAERGVDLDALLYCIKADLDGEGRYVDLYLTFDRENLYLVKGLGGVERVRSTGYLKPTFQFQDYEEIPLKKIQSGEMERLVHSGRMILTDAEGNQRQLCRFSIALCDPFDKFCERLTKTVRGEPIDDTYLADRTTCVPVATIPIRKRTGGCVPTAPKEGP